MRRIVWNVIEQIVENLVDRATGQPYATDGDRPVRVNETGTRTTDCVCEYTARPLPSPCVRPVRHDARNEKTIFHPPQMLFFLFGFQKYKLAPKRGTTGRGRRRQRSLLCSGPSGRLPRRSPWRPVMLA